VTTVRASGIELEIIHDIKKAKEFFGNMAKFKYLEKMNANQKNMHK
jgi:hypothetical protein